MISHFNIISNIIQMTLLQSVGRKQDNVDTENVLGILPLSHIYGLTVVAHVSQYRGDQLVILPKFDLPLFLRTIQDYKLNFLPVVPPMLIQLITNQQVVAKYNLDSVRCVFSGAAPLGIETQEAANKMYPKWKIGQGYGAFPHSPSSLFFLFLFFFSSFFSLLSFSFYFHCSTPYINTFANFYPKA